MIDRDWEGSLQASADPARAARHLELLRASTGEAPLARLGPESRRVLASLLAGSRALSGLLCRHPDWLDLFQDVERLGRPRRKQGIKKESSEAFANAPGNPEDAAAISRLHDLRLRELLRIGARDLARIARLEEIVVEVSNLADVFLDGILRSVWPPQVQRFGVPWNQDANGAWLPTQFCVLGMGKLGGQELNYSSDVDLLFVYSDEGFTFRNPPKRKAATGQALANHQFFKRLCEAFIREATSRGIEGGGLRIDLRLRPEGESGPLARSLDSYENFYAEWGQTWERMMLLKARPVAGDTALGGEFLEVVQPFRYPRSLGEGIFSEMAEMKARIESDVVRAGELDRNVKLGRGGIREIEFVAQSLQVLHGGRNPFLQTPHTLSAIPKLAEYRLIEAEEAAALTEAYPFLRDVEHRLQMEEQHQVHTLPSAEAEILRLARLMGFPNAKPFLAAISRHFQRVRAVYDRVVGRADTPSAKPSLPGSFEQDAEAWQALLVAHRFRDPDKGVKLLRAFVHGTGVGHVSRRTTDLGRRLIPKLLELCPSPTRPHGEGEGEDCFVLSDPDRVLVRLDNYIAAYGARASLYELWAARPGVLEHLLKLFDRSEFLAELSIRVPDLVDELEIGGHIRRQKDAAQTLADLRHGAKDKDQHLWVRRYFQTEFMRLGLRDILGLVTAEEAKEELTALAEACLQHAVEVVARRHGLRQSPFAVIGLGKLGGMELVYGSDLDLLLVAPDTSRNLPRLQKLAGEVIDLLSARTEQGSVFALDTRLRPDGEKGLLVNSLKAHEDYYRNRAMLWEIQALTRARWVAGHVPTGKAFDALTRRLANFHAPSLPLQCLAPDWKSQIARMRLRIQRERTPVGKDALAFKTGVGGLVDAEFLAQTLALEHGWFETNTLRSLGRAREAGALPPADAVQLIDHYRQLSRMEAILRRWSFEGEAVLPEDPAAQYRVAVRCGYREATVFLQDVARWRTGIREVYGKVFGRAAE